MTGEVQRHFQPSAATARVVKPSGSNTIQLAPAPNDDAEYQEDVSALRPRAQLLTPSLSIHPALHLHGRHVSEGGGLGGGSNEDPCKCTKALNPRQWSRYNVLPYVNRGRAWHPCPRVRGLAGGPAAGCGCGRLCTDAWRTQIRFRHQKSPRTSTSVTWKPDADKTPDLAPLSRRSTPAPAPAPGLALAEG